jgi:hypothetical protein
MCLNPPSPPLPKGGTDWISVESPPLKKGDLGGFQNQQSEEIFGKRYNLSPGATADLREGRVRVDGTAFYHTSAPKHEIPQDAGWIAGYLREGMNGKNGRDGWRGK